MTGQRWKCKQLYDSDEYIFQITNVQAFLINGIIVQPLSWDDNIIRCGEKAFVHKYSKIAFTCQNNDCSDFCTNKYVALEYLEGQDVPKCLF